MFIFVIDVPIKYWIKNRNICRAYSNQDKSSIKIWNRSWNLSEWSVLLPVLPAKHLMRQEHNRNDTQTLHVWSAILCSHCPCSHILEIHEWEFCRKMFTPHCIKRTLSITLFKMSITLFLNHQNSFNHFNSVKINYLKITEENLTRNTSHINEKMASFSFLHSYSVKQKIVPNGIHSSIQLVPWSCLS